MSATQHNPFSSARSTIDETVSTPDDWAADGAAQQLIAFLMASDPDSMDCREILDVIARYVDLEALSGQSPDWMYPINTHLDACDHCHELYDVLRFLASRGDTLDPDLEQLWDRVHAETGALEAGSGRPPPL